MTFNKPLLILAAIAMSAAGINSASADEPGFWARLNPFRRVISQSSDTPDQVRNGPSEEQLAELRQQLEGRGLTSEQVDARIARVQEARSSAGQDSGRPAFSGEGRPSLEQIREHLISRGVDPTGIDTRIDQAAAASTRGQQGLDRSRAPQRDADFSRQTAMPAVVVNEITTASFTERAEGLRPDAGFVQQTVSENASTESPASTAVSPSFRQDASGLRGGFARGRSRGE